MPRLFDNRLGSLCPNSNTNVLLFYFKNSLRTYRVLRGPMVRPPQRRPTKVRRGTGDQIQPMQETSIRTGHRYKLGKSSHRDHGQRDSRPTGLFRVTPRADRGGTGNRNGRRGPPDQQGSQGGGQVSNLLRQGQARGVAEASPVGLYVDAYGEGPTEGVATQDPHQRRPLLPLRCTRTIRRTHSMALPSA